MKQFVIDTLMDEKPELVLDAVGEDRPWNGWSTPIVTVEQFREFIAKWQELVGDDCPLGDVHEDVDDKGNKVMWIENEYSEEGTDSFASIPGSEDPVLYVIDGWTWLPKES